ncbi:hypothetical protein DTL42_24575 [Bremerella cremea]|uniref:Peptidase M56 domain-containing protein n=1 Tax=Bremerella cremea TaxID=1031537 RepID=A0A368KJ01_9BACT|nr:M56 family metallopeptidase [Bremerella cremea]RCS40551.1 hypothetical protein DTL42_24575 [Bremerella cremea]
MWSLLQSPVAMKLTFVLLHFFWQALLLLCLWRLLASLLALRTAEARYLGALATLMMMGLCPFATYLLLDTDKLPPVADFSEGPSATTDVPGASLQTSAFASMADAEINHFEPTASSVTSHFTIAGLITTYQPYVIFGWLLGVLLLGGRICLSYLGTIWIRRVGLSGVESHVLVQFSEIAQRLQIWHLPPIAYSSRISQAMTVGLMRPMVLLPVSWMAEISPDVLEAVLAHELAHVKRLDLWVNFFQRLMETVFFFHPAVWLVSAEVRRERESCCDELAIAATGQRLDYAKSLHEVAYRQMTGTSPMLTLPFLGQRSGELLGRVRRVLGATSPQAGERSWPAGLILIVAPLCLWAILAIVFPQISTTANAEDKPSPEESTPVEPSWRHSHPEDGSLRRKRRPQDRNSHRPAARKDAFDAKDHASSLHQFDLESLDPEDQAMMLVLRSLRQEVHILREQVKELRQESPRKRRKARRLEELLDEPTPTIDDDHEE